MTKYTPAEVFPPGEFLQDELDARGWSVEDLAKRMGGDVNVNHCCIDLILHVHDKELTIGQETAEQLAKALGTSAELWLNLCKAWRESPAQPTP